MAGVSDIIADMIGPALTQMGYDLVRVFYSGTPGTGRHQLQIMAEPLDPREMTVADCQKISKYVAALLDVEDPIKDAYNLEVTSQTDDRWAQKIKRPSDRPRCRWQDFARYHLWPAGFCL